MAKKKIEAPAEEIHSEIPEGFVEITPEQFAEMQNGGMQTVMSIGLGEKLYLEDLTDRVFYLDAEVGTDLFHSVITPIAKINGMDYGIPIEQREPIKLIISSFGGSVYEGLALCDVIRQSRTPVIGICLGYAMSMAFAIFSVCHTRVATPNAVFMYHDGWSGVENTTTKVRDWAAFEPKLSKRVDKMIAESSKLTVEYLDSISGHDNYWFTDEMIEKGIVDGIIGKDIEMEEIFAFMSGMTCGCPECSG